MNDLDENTPGYDELASSSANDGAGWEPIGNHQYNFKGSFDGDGFTIYDLYINRPDEEYIGLFGYGYSAEIVNINMNSVNITGQKYVAGIIGDNHSGTVDNCNVTGSINGTSLIGGIVGYNSDSIIRNSLYTGQITGVEGEENISSIGGITGHNDQGELNSNSTNVSISVDGFCTDIGGIGGYNYGSITNCNSEGTMTISTTRGYKFGGLVGMNQAKTITNSYSTVDVTVTNSTSTEGMVGGLVGHNNDGTINNSYSNGTIKGTYRVGGLIGYNNGYVYTSYSASEIIGLGDNQSFLGGLLGQNQYGTVENCYSTGDITGDSSIGGLVGYNGDRSSIKSSYSIGIPSGSSSLGGLVGINYGDITDSMSLESSSYGNVNGGDLFGRVTEAPQDVMQKDDIYTEETLAGYDDMNAIWDSSIWNFGTDSDYPKLNWQ